MHAGDAGGTKAATLAAATGDATNHLRKNEEPPCPRPTRLIEFIATAIDIHGVSSSYWGTTLAIGMVIFWRFFGKPTGDRYTTFRVVMGRGMLIGLEVLLRRRYDHQDRRASSRTSPPTGRWVFCHYPHVPELVLTLELTGAGPGKKWPVSRLTPSCQPPCPGAERLQVSLPSRHATSRRVAPLELLPALPARWARPQSHTRTPAASSSPHSRNCVTGRHPPALAPAFLHPERDAPRWA